MNTSEQKSIVQYSTIVICVICFIVAFIYQNIEYMQLKMQYDAMVNEYKTVVEEYDRQKYILQKAVSMKNLDAFAQLHGLVPMSKDSVVIVENNSKNTMQEQR
ncbi:MAG TPA: hypothetical protein PLV62_03710 [Spirochaetota bacterium]|nr:hypothetical protein [Spirochaetota bacterium]HOM86975.1 hypothetical protein [Spirochaetota bacterium]HPD04489.1 hypothetical protein [Spirochaetota bacterium]HPK44066.1 hypothetical protein [Spirochaetota bacterium]HRR59978.1 hypothetical protein [Spirochaetota bacterium]